MTELTFSNRQNAARNAKRRLADGTAPAAAYTIAAVGPRFTIVWAAEAPATTAEIEAEIEAELEAPPAEPAATADARMAAYENGELTATERDLAANEASVEPAASVEPEPAAVIARLTQLVAEGRLTLEQIAEATGLTAPRRRATRPAGERAPRTSAGAPRGKAQALDAAAARGETPAKPDVTSHANAHYQKRFDRLAELAAAGDWTAVAAYECNGVNTYAKMVRQYRDRLLAAHAAQQAATGAAA